MRDYIENSLEEVDAGIFSGDLLWNDAERKAVKEYAERWLRAVAEHESLNPEGESNA